jgi:hypothetical protein
MFAELPAEVQSQARRAYRVFSRIRTNRVFVSSLFILHGPFILFGSVPVTEQWEILESDEIVWYWIGSHADYDKLLSQSRRRP